VIDGAREFADFLRSRLESAPDGAPEHEVRVLGPAPAPIAMYRGRHRHHLLLKLPTHACDAALAALRAVRGELRSLAPTIDVDPVSML
jgi:primosomal protein N' (replication factor Y)